MEVLIGLPTYDGSRRNTMALAGLLKATGASQSRLHLVEIKISLLTHAFNALWATALNLRDRVTHFLLWHADVVPTTANWLDVLLAEQRRVGADVLSAVIPLKNETGMTSTALDTDRWEPLRYSLKEVHDGPVTWTTPSLLVNTGLMLVEFTKPWVEQVCFTIRDDLYRHPTSGKWLARVEPEDWHFSRQCRALGVRVFATRAVAVSHVGEHRYPSDQVWGFATDTELRTFLTQQRRQTTEESLPDGPEPPPSPPADGI